MRWFERHVPPDGVYVRPASMDYPGLSIAGPKSRELLQLVRKIVEEPRHAGNETLKSVIRQAEALFRDEEHQVAAVK